MNSIKSYLPNPTAIVLIIGFIALYAASPNTRLHKSSSLEAFNWFHKPMFMVALSAVLCLVLFFIGLMKYEKWRKYQSTNHG